MIKVNETKEALYLGGKFKIEKKDWTIFCGIDNINPTN